ncbi:hypothetical protein [uncultured Winogradskyella sp.]|uniref:hypothetical protein n=1 Tax=uncultured Winogradskyella sp. TaxID=395353 RepID=UPI0026332BCB|nr:hypothetical protein [uncultured Winogradskyella sp.]
MNKETRKTPIATYTSSLANHSISKLKAKRYALSLNPENLPEPPEYINSYKNSIKNGHNVQ